MQEMVTPAPWTAPASASPSAGDEIQRLRVARGLSLRGLAQQAGVSAAALSRWEAGKRTPSIPELEAVLTALDVPDQQRRAILSRIDAPRAVQRLRELTETSVDAYNGGGELLWAMRQRKGWTQAQTAKAAGVTQAQVARWERGDAWPGTEDLLRLCGCLDAHAEETAALTRRDGGEARRSAGGLLFSHKLPQQGDRTQWTDYVSRLLRHPPPEAVAPLTFIGVQQRLSLLAAQHDFAAGLLPDVYAIHARYCLHRKQVRQATQWAERGLGLVRQWRSVRAVGVGGRALFFGNVLALASSAGISKRPAELRRAGKLLEDWLPAMRQASETRDADRTVSATAHHAWGQMVRAENLHLLGYTSEALACAQSSCDEAERLCPGEGFMRLCDFTRLLCAARQPERGLHALNRGESLIPESEICPSTRARLHLLKADCLRLLGDTQNASDLVRLAEQLIVQNRLRDLHEDLHRVTIDL